MQVIEEFMSLADGQAVLRSPSSQGEQAQDPVIPDTASSSSKDCVFGGFGPEACSISIPGNKSARVSAFNLPYNSLPINKDQFMPSKQT